MLINIFTALATGGAVVVGHMLGESNERRAKTAAWQMILFSMVASLFVMLFYLGIHEWVLTKVFGSVEPQVYESARSYLLITALSIVPLAVYNCCCALFRAVSNSRVTMWISLLMNIFNIVGNYLLIYVVKMGVAGAALSTTFARTVAAVLSFVLLYRAKNAVSFKGYITWKPNFTYIKKILYIGLPNGLENSLFQLGKIVLLSLVSTLGTYAIAANAVSNTIAAFNILPGMAINYAVLSVCSYCAGAKRYDQVKYYTKKLLSLIYVCMWCLSITIMLGGSVILKLYHLSPEAYELTKTVILYHAIMAMITWVPSFSLSNALRSVGDVLYPTSIAIISMWIFRIGAAYLLCGYFHMGLMGVWIAMTIDWAFRAICYLIRFFGGAWERNLSKKKHF